MQTFLKGCANILFFIVGIWALILDFQIIIYEWGFGGAVLSFLLLPIAFVVAPFYALFKYGIWMPIIVTYGGGLFTYLLLVVSGANECNEEKY